MGKYTSVGVIPCFRAVGSRLGGCKYISLAVKNVALGDILGKGFLPLIEIVVYNLVALEDIEINEITYKSHENNQKGINDYGILTVLFPEFFVGLPDLSAAGAPLFRPVPVQQVF